MHRSIVIAAALVVAAVALLAAACGSAGEPATGHTTGVGDTVDVAGASSRLEVTLEETRWLPAVTSGDAEVRPALFGVRLAIRNLDGRFYDDAISLCAKLTDGAGQTHDVAWEIVHEHEDTVDDVLEGVMIQPGGERAGWVYFALEPDAEPSTLRFTPESGFGAETGVWTLE